MFTCDWVADITLSEYLVMYDKEPRRAKLAVRNAGVSNIIIHSSHFNANLSTLSVVVKDLDVYNTRGLCNYDLDHPPPQ